MKRSFKSTDSASIGERLVAAGWKGSRTNANEKRTANAEHRFLVRGSYKLKLPANCNDFLTLYFMSNSTASWFMDIPLEVGVEKIVAVVDAATR